MRFSFVFFVACVACNAIDGADQYKKVGDGSASCEPQCLTTAATCLSDCNDTHTTCLAGCSNPGCTNKCESDFSTCKSGCISPCTGCGCSQSQCQNATITPDASTD